MNSEHKNNYYEAKSEMGSGWVGVGGSNCIIVGCDKTNGLFVNIRNSEKTKHIKQKT